MTLKEKLEPLLLKVQKPARYIGGELNSVMKDKNKVETRVALCFPDNYEIGMSHLGLKILYSLINKREDCWAERVYAPWIDFEALMRENDIPLYGLESLDPLTDFDVVGFSLQYELSYTNILNMLDLGGIEPLASVRGNDEPLIIAGGPCAMNPEPLADFIDLFQIGEGEEVMLEMIDLLQQHKKKGWDKRSFLREAAQIPGIYVPSLYDVTYDETGIITSVTPKDGAPEKVTKRIIKDMDKVFYPETFIVPYTETVHDRAVLEVMRGCIRGCRFCQAGFIYRPIRAKTPDTLCRQGKSLCDTTGYDEMSLSSLSTSDHPQVEELLDKMIDYTEAEKVNLSLPSLRVDNFSEELLQKVSRVRKSGLTFAPEAGTQRLRDVINKNVSEEEVMETCRIAFEGGYMSVKLYFMLGLPTETIEDVTGITALGQRIVDMYYSLPTRKKGKAVNVSISVSTFVPKCFTPFQWCAQDTFEQIVEKQKALQHSVTTKKISLSWHEVKTSVLEGVVARGDRRLGKAIYNAWKMGCKFDSWDECFDFEKWKQAIRDAGLTIEFYANRVREENEILPWDHIDVGVSKKFLWREYQKAVNAQVTPNCKENCAGCGANKLIGGGVCIG
ncbi:TIGR03960 family B12-binding radical SAM protein [Fumia xinanensis]|uniref:TIGR03960 family B12-binding radical SAM protein n=1 Tax=Fumia xinanensis TaxID=2763659 RepID=A0A926DZE2_9FIRM|nr:TIGR03960 family B12-binding radical SAM protein [Fumia xinanensis]MBC8558486.1 TIGR03960 family B12-binding radical SAM protein [Fumia xinanensis]